MRSKLNVGDIVIPDYDYEKLNEIPRSFGIVTHSCERLCRIFWPITGHKQVCQQGYGSIKKLGE